MKEGRYRVAGRQIVMGAQSRVTSGCGCGKVRRGRSKVIPPAAAGMAVRPREIARKRVRRDVMVNLVLDVPDIKLNRFVRISRKN